MRPAPRHRKADMEKAAFRKDFVWGAASSAYQIEGSPQADGGGVSVWDVFCDQPDNIFEGDDGKTACDAYHRYAEDIGLLASTGLKAYRFSISWTRVDPLGEGRWNEAGFEYYDKVIDCCLENGVEPYLTLHHWELPQALEDKGGWLKRETAEAFARFAGECARRLKGRVSHYFTLNEPECVLNLGYKLAIHAPGKKYGLEGQFECWKNMMLAHGMAQRAVKAEDPAALVGLASTGRLCYAGSDSPGDKEAAYTATFELSDDDWLFTHTPTLDAICFGRFPDCPGTELEKLAAGVSPEEWRTMNAAPDFIGINVYNGNEVRAGADGKPEYVERYTGFPRTALKWPVTPGVMRGGILNIWRRYGLPIYITEDGQGCNDRIFLDGKVHDPDRIDFLTRYLRELREAARTADIRGYFHWSLTDNFEWSSGYADRFGLIFIDYPTQRRIPKDSAYWYSKIVESNGEDL